VELWNRGFVSGLGGFLLSCVVFYGGEMGLWVVLWVRVWACGRGEMGARSSLNYVTTRVVLVTSSFPSLYTSR